MRNIAVTFLTALVLSIGSVGSATAYTTYMDSSGGGFFDFGNTLMGYGDYAGTTIFRF